MQDIAPTLEHFYTFLNSPLVQFLLRIHPNDLATTQEANAPREFGEWSPWSREEPDGWLEIVHYYMTGNEESPIPITLRCLLDKIRGLQLDRSPITLAGTLPQIKETGMSPKKAHEVSRMTAYILQTIRVNNWDLSVLRIVDVGAGQGYLTRSLKAQLPQTQILALDADEAQTIGARRWESHLLPSPSHENPPITHKTIHITPEALYSTIDAWIAGTRSPALLEKAAEAPVLLVGLHACGSLTPDLIRVLNQNTTGQKRWKFMAAVVVGCCYNLMNPSDFPLSRCYTKDLSPTIDLPASAYHLAAQIPTQWLLSLSPPIPASSVRLALRKVTWRASLGKKLRHMRDESLLTNNHAEIHLAPGRQLPWSRLPATKTEKFNLNEEGTGATPEMRRLGRLSDTAYKDWETFIDVAGKKMGVDFGCVADREERDLGMERSLEVFHTLRCLVGPVVESTIILDRLQWVAETLRAEGREELQVSMVNLFDQSTGSGRNVAIVMAPKIPPSDNKP